MTNTNLSSKSCKAQTRNLPIAELKTEGLQCRAEMNHDTIAEYIEAMANKVKFPPLVVFSDGKTYWLADGFHRLEAATQAGSKQIACEVRTGKREDALKFSLSANSRHGLPRTNKDKRNAVSMALDAWPKLSSREIAKLCAVSDVFVGNVRDQLQTVSSCDTQERLGADGKIRRVAPPKPRVRPVPAEVFQQYQLLSGDEKMIVGMALFHFDQRKLPVPQDQIAELIYRLLERQPSPENN